MRLVIYFKTIWSWVPVRFVLFCTFYFVDVIITTCICLFDLLLLPCSIWLICLFNFGIDGLQFVLYCLKQITCVEHMPS